MGAHSQVGLVAVASCEDYLNGIIKKHELTRPDKEDDRVRHIETLNSQTGPVFLTLSREHADRAGHAERISDSRQIDFTAKDGVRHTAWVVAEPAQTFGGSKRSLAAIPFLYIADGHHRSAAAARVYQSAQGARAKAVFSRA